MKHLTEFLAEAMQTQAEQNNDSKTITFDENGATISTSPITANDGSTSNKQR